MIFPFNKRSINSTCKCYLKGENTILVPTLYDYSQFSTYILIVANLVIVIFNLQPI